MIGCCVFFCYGIAYDVIAFTVVVCVVIACDVIV